MFAQKTTSQICRSCKAPNPRRLATCYACGATMPASDPNLPREGEETFACLQCQGSVPYRATACPHCERPLARPERPKAQGNPMAKPPGTWKARPLPDGTFLLEQPGWERWFKPVAPGLASPLASFGLQWGISLFICLALYIPYQLLRNSADPFVVAIWSMGIGITLMVFWFLFTLLIREVIRVGDDFLERRRDFWFYHAHRRIQGGVLRIETTHHTVNVRYDGSYGVMRDGLGSSQHLWIRTLTASDGTVSITIHQTTHTAPLFQGEPTVQRFAFDEITRLAQYLEGLTGWQSIDPPLEKHGIV